MLRDSVIPYGIAHGRFQPFHLEHLNYVNSIIARCRVCVVAITNPDPTERVFEKTSSHRHLAEANPYTYFERAEMIRRSLLGSSLDKSQFVIVPLYLNDPTKWEHFLPPKEQSVFFVRVFSDWERRKIQLFRDNGYSVEQVDIGYTKSITGTDVRRAIRKGDNWAQLVPEGTRETIVSVTHGRHR